MAGIREKMKSKIKNKVEDVLHPGHKEDSGEHKLEDYSGGESKEEHGAGHLTGFVHKMKNKAEKKLLVGGHVGNQHGEEEEKKKEGEVIKSGENGKVGGVPLGQTLGGAVGTAVTEVLVEESGVAEGLVEAGGGILASLCEVLSSIQI